MVIGMKLYTDEMERIIENKIKPNMMVIYRMRTQGLKDRHIATALGITTSQFGRAMEQYPEAKEVYDDATILLCSRLREVAIDRALGTDNKLDKDGNPVGPDANLAVRLLEKLDPTFGNNQEVHVTVTIEDVVRQLNAKRRDEEEARRVVIEKNEHKGLVLE